MAIPPEPTFDVELREGRVESDPHIKVDPSVSMRRGRPHAAVTQRHAGFEGFLEGILTAEPGETPARSFVRQGDQGEPAFAGSQPPPPACFPPDGFARKTSRLRYGTVLRFSHVCNSVNHSLS